MRTKLLLIFTFCIASLCASGQVPPGAVGEYYFSGNLDNSAGSQDFTTSASSLTYFSDRFGNALSSIYIDSNIFNGYTYTGTNNNVSISFWVNISVNDPATQRLVQLIDNSGKGFKITYQPNGPLTQVDFESVNDAKSAGTVSVPKGQWVHLALTIEQTSTGFSNNFYINGVLDTNVSSAISSNRVSQFLTSNATFKLSPFTGQAFSGTMDDVVLYERALSQAEVTSLFNATDPRVCTVNIPDANFKAALVANTTINTNGDAEIQCSEASNYNGVINFVRFNINDATGIEAFTNITGLILANNNLTTIDLQNNTSLTNLNLGGNDLNTVDISANTLLETLNVINNNLVALDVSSQPSLETFLASGNAINSIDLSTNTNLLTVGLGNNNISTIDLSSNILIGDLSIVGNSLSSIDVSPLVSLTDLSLGNNNIASIDLSSNTAITYIDLTQNSLQNLDLTNNNLIERIFVFDNQLTSLNIANNNNAAINTLRATSNPNLGCIQIDSGFTPPSGWQKDATASYSDNCNASACTVNIPDANFKAALVANTTINTNGDAEIQCSEASNYNGEINFVRFNINDATGIEAFTNITGLILVNNNLTTIDLQNNTSLTNLNLGGNDLNTIDISANTLLETFNVINNNLVALDVSSQPSLETFLASGNAINSIDLSTNTNLLTVGLGNNNISTIDLSSNTLIDILGIVSNSLTSIDVSALTSVTNLSLGNNNIASIDLSSNASLTLIDLTQNSLQNLDLTSNNLLEKIFVFDNQLTSLNIANNNNSAITTLNATSNPNLGCIQIDSGFTPPSGWQKDATTSYSDNCNASACTVNIPDANFKAALIGDTAINTNGDAEIQCDEASQYTGAINLGNSNINSLVGIEAFINATILRASRNNLSNVDLSNNTAFVDIDLTFNSLTALDVSNLVNLEVLSCGSNSLNTIDLSQNINLTTLSISGNQLATLNVTNNLNLDIIVAEGNALAGTLDITQNNLLTFLSVANNDLNTIDITNNGNLTTLNVSTNELTELNLANGNNAALGTMNATSNSNLSCIQIDAGFSPPSTWTKDTTTSYSDNCAASNCIVNLPDANFKAALIGDTAINTNGDAEIQCDEASLFTGTIDVSNQNIFDLTGIEAFTNLTQLFAEDNGLSSIDLQNNTELLTISFLGNNLTSLDVTNLIKLESLTAGENGISSIDLSQNIKLETLDLSFNNLNTIDVSNNINLEVINLGQNSLSTINTTNLSMLRITTLNSNQFTSIDFSNNPALTSVNLINNQLTDLDLANGNNPTLAVVRVTNNPDLTCIQIDSGFTPPSNNWLKDATANYSDNCSNTTDIQDPVAVCQDVTLQLDSNGTATLTAAQVDNGSSDDVGVASIAIDITSFDCSNVGSTTVTLTVMDAAGNSDTCTATITVEDNEAPIITCPADETVSVDQGDQYTIPNYTLSFQDNCSATINQSPAAGTTIGAGVQTITFTATDPSGNTSDCSFDLTVDETLSVKDQPAIKVSVYPNPVTDILMIDTATPVEKVDVYALSGQKVFSTTSSQVEMSTLSTGIYFVHITTGQGSSYKRVIKQ
ncbi:LamG-like jellyroll fold domain-containing protein [Dokdonia sp. Hel_I_53]|uniref:LamG-like jellyroll fold domain-containing protein n=1 Tax=Dokdonia sp. Hel_I_53 TaxID=1566287 RepID=UPI00119A1082|nr:LamG-like jellyroll fold domain-containing protein [Dokdonia sp. Hel_I_53]TVZ52464.1 putative secreted protein (Por secretion system target) [Dokdonia sp. Hel_I_53]